MEGGARQLISGRSRAGGDLFSIFFSRLNSFGWKGFYCYHHHYYYMWCNFPTHFSQVLGEIIGEKS